MPSCCPMAAAVTAGSPVIIRNQDAGGVCGRDGPFASVGAVDDPDQGQQLQSVDQGEQITPGCRRRPGRRPCERTRSPAAPAPRTAGSRPGSAARTRDRPAPGRRRHSGRCPHGPAAAPGALDEAAHHPTTVPVGHPMEGVHQFVVHIERRLGDPPMGLPGGHRVDAAFHRQRDRGTLGWGRFSSDQTATSCRQRRLASAARGRRPAQELHHRFRH